MSKLLINEPPLQVLPTLAAKVGLNEAIFLQQLHYWLQLTKHHRDGKPWVYNKVSEWAKQFPFWSVPTIRRIINSLRDAGIVEVSDKYNRIPIDKTLWYTIDYSKIPSDQIGDSSDETVTPCDQVDQSSAQVDHMERSDCASLSDQVDHNNNQRLPETTAETTDRDFVGASAPTPDASTQKTGWEKWLEALCWVCHGHKDITRLSVKDANMLTAEAKRIKENKLDDTELLKRWYVQAWQSSDTWHRNKRSPSAYEVRCGLPAYAAAQQEAQQLMEDSLNHRQSKPPAPKPALPDYDDPWAVTLMDLGMSNERLAETLGRASAEMIGEQSESQVWQITLDPADADDYGWIKTRGAVVIRKTLGSVLQRAVLVDVLLPEAVPG